MIWCSNETEANYNRKVSMTITVNPYSAEFLKIY